MICLWYICGLSGEKKALIRINSSKLQVEHKTVQYIDGGGFWYLNKEYMWKKCFCLSISIELCLLFPFRIIFHLYSMRHIQAEVCTWYTGKSGQIMEKVTSKCDPQLSYSYAFIRTNEQHTVNVPMWSSTSSDAVGMTVTELTIRWRCELIVDLCEYFNIECQNVTLNKLSCV